MKILRNGHVVMLGAILTEVFERAPRRLAGQVALYVVGLLDPRGLALAAAVHRCAPGGPDPVELRDRAAAMGAVEPLVVGAAGVDTVAAALSALGGADPPDRALLGWTVREIHRAGGVPVVVLTDGIALVTTLDTLTAADEGLTAWALSRQPVGEA
jgi:hypothetical protein